MTYRPLPESGFVDRLDRLKRQGGKRWRDTTSGWLYEHDPLHGDLEVYNSRGRHLGSADPVTGELIKPPEKGRRITDV